MEELYGLMNDRFQVLKEINDKFRDASNLSKNGFKTNSGGNEIQKLSEYLSQLKRAEKLRVIQENNYLEVVCSLRGYDDCQLMYFSISRSFFLPNKCII